VIDSVHPRYDPYYFLQEEQTVKDAVAIFLKGVHLIAVTNKQQQIVHILSTTDLIQYLAKNFSKLGIKGEVEVVNTGLMQSRVISVTSDTLAIDAFRMMHEKRISSVGIEIEGVLVGTVNVSDLVGVKEFNFLKLFQTVTEYIADVRKKQGKNHDYILCVDTSNPLKMLLEIFAAESVHRIFVVDHSMRSVGVVSASDVIKEFFIN